MNKKKRIHPLYKDLEGKKQQKLVGKHQYLYSSDKGKISLIKIKDASDKWIWEIYSLKGELFEDIERYDSKKEAEKRIKKLLN